MFSMHTASRTRRSSPSPFCCGDAKHSNEPATAEETVGYERKGLVSEDVTGLPSPLSLSLSLSLAPSGVHQTARDSNSCLRACCTRVGVKIRLHTLSFAAVFA